MISFVMMTMVLNISNSPHIARFTGVIAGALVASYITLESPLSGMSMSPARSFASAFPGRIWNSLWVYFTAPPLGMLLAAELYLRLWGKHAVFAPSCTTTTTSGAYSAAITKLCQHQSL